MKQAYRIVIFSWIIVNLLTSGSCNKPPFKPDFVGTFEIICGALILIGKLTRVASIPLLIIMIVAMATTKAEILASKGFWEMMHGSRTDWSMLLANIFLLIKGGGYWSVDNKLYNTSKWK